MKKRILALMLACFMIVSLLPMQVFAEETVAGKCPGDGAKHAKSNCTYEVFKEVPPICDDWGYTIYACTECGDHFVDDIVEQTGTHSWVEQEFVPATCTTDGIVGGWYCELCGENEDEAKAVIPAGHEWGETIGDCAYAYRTCQVCGLKEETEGNHDFVGNDGMFNVTSVINPNGNTCGIATYACENCDYTYDVVILHTLHFVPGVDHTVDEEGNYVLGWIDHYECTTCGTTYSVRSVETGYWHDYYSWIWIPGYLPEYDELMNGGHNTLEELPVLEEIDPTQHHNYVETNATYPKNEYGNDTCGFITREYTCTICGHSYEEVDTYKSHTGRELRDTVAPTCETWGYDFYFCVSCGESWQENLREPLGHDFGDWYQVGCNEDGTAKDRRDCERFGCDFYEERDRECGGMPHVKVVYQQLDPNCSTQGFAYWYCECCGANGIDVLERNLDAHYGELIYVVDPTCTEDGFEFWYCHWCDLNYKVVLPALNHEIHTITYDSCHSTYTEKWCYYCDYSEVTEVLKEEEPIFIFDETVTLEEIEAMHGVHYTYEIIDREGHALDINRNHITDWWGNYVYGLAADEYWIGFGDPVNYKEPTCGYFGYNEYYCSVCFSNFMHIIPAHGNHRFEGELESYVVDAANPNKVIDSWFGTQEVAEVFYGIDYKGGNISFTMTGDFENSWFEWNFFTSDGKNIWEHANVTEDWMTYTFVDEEGNALWELIITSDDATYMTFTFVGIDYIGLDLMVNYGAITVTPYLESDLFEAMECHVEDGKLIEGWEKHMFCVDCRQMVILDEYNNVVADKEHHIEYAGARVEPTCTTAGWMEGWYCEICDNYFIYDEETESYYEVETLYIEPLGHDIQINWQAVQEEDWINIIHDERRLEHSDGGLLFAYTHYFCANGCELDFIADYHNGVDHTWVLNEERSYLPTCTETGLNSYDCDCGAIRDDVIAALGHTWEETPCDEYCRKCTVCEFEVVHNSTLEVVYEWGVKYVVIDGIYYPEIIASMPATCSTGAYDLHHCYDCGHEWAITTSEPVPEESPLYPFSHMWGPTVEEVDENGYRTGNLSHECILCGLVESWNNNWVDYGVTVGDNVVVPNSPITENSEIRVNININGNHTMIWGFDLKVFFENEHVEFVGAEINRDSFNYLLEAQPVDADNDGYFDFVGVAGSCASEAEVVEELTLTLVFRAIEETPWSATGFSLVVDDTLDLAGNHIPEVEYVDPASIPEYEDLVIASNYDDAVIRMLMDIDGDWDIDLEDLRLCYLLFLADEYDVVADADQLVDENGEAKVTLEDLKAIYNYILVH